jgi:hypothetical protein
LTNLFQRLKTGSGATPKKYQNVNIPPKSTSPGGDKKIPQLRNPVSLTGGKKRGFMRRMLKMPEVGSLLVLASLLHRVALRAGLHNSKISVRRSVKNWLLLRTAPLNEKR